MGSLRNRKLDAVVPVECLNYSALMSSDAEAGEVLNLFKARVPEIASGVITIRGAVRDPGKRTILAVASTDAATDPVGTCVGVRGAVVKSICADLHGEFIDIVRWSDSPETFITNLLAPIQLAGISLDEASRQATVFLRAESELPPQKAQLKSRL